MNTYLQINWNQLIKSQEKKNLRLIIIVNKHKVKKKKTLQKNEYTSYKKRNIKLI